MTLTERSPITSASAMRDMGEVVYPIRLDRRSYATAGEATHVLPQRPAWHAEALCRGSMVDGESPWFPTRGGPTQGVKQVCEVCPVRDDCLDAGLSEAFGVWGGLAERSRRSVRRLAWDPAALLAEERALEAVGIPHAERRELLAARHGVTTHKIGRRLQAARHYEQKDGAA